jgi:glycosyltransferase involved in cell wall biosynthesis
MKKKCLIYVVCYNHEKFILNTLERIPQKLNEDYDVEILVANDKSKDKTLVETKKFVTKSFKYNILTMLFYYMVMDNMLLNIYQKY